MHAVGIERRQTFAHLQRNIGVRGSYVTLDTSPPCGTSFGLRRDRDVSDLMGVQVLKTSSEH